MLGCLAPKTRQKIFPHSCAPCSPPHTPPKGNVILIVTVSQVLKFINRINLNVASFTQANIFFLMIKAQFLKTTCLFTWLPGLSRHTAPSLCHAGSSLQHRDSPVAVQAELLCDGGSSASRPWTGPQPPLHGTTRKSPASHLWGVFFFSPPAVLGLHCRPCLLSSWAERKLLLSCGAGPFRAAASTVGCGPQGTASLTFFRFIRVAAMYS